MARTDALDGFRGGLQGWFRNSSFNVGTQLVGLCGSVATAVVLARLAGVEGLGLYGFAGGFATLFGTLTSLALAIVLAREVSRDPSHRHDLLRSALGLSAAVCLPLGVLLTAGAALAAGLARASVAAAVLFALLQAVRNGKGVVFGYLQGRSSFHRVTIIEAIFVPVVLVAGTAALAAGGGTVAFILGSAVAEGVLLVGLLRYVHRRICPLRSPGSTARWRGLARQGFVVSLATMAAAVNLRSDVILLGFWRGPEAVGIYSAAFTFYVALGTFAGAVSHGCLPTVSRLHTTDARATRRLVRAGAIALTVAGGVLAVALWAGASPLIALTYGQAFDRALPVLRVLCVAVPVMAAARFLSTALMAVGAHKAILVVSACGAAAHVAVSALAIGPLDATGAALGALAGELTVVAVAWWALLRRSGALAMPASPVEGAMPAVPPALST